MGYDRFWMITNAAIILSDAALARTQDAKQAAIEQIEQWLFFAMHHDMDQKTVATLKDLLNTAKQLEIN